MNKTNIAIKSTFISILVFIIQGVLIFWRTSVIIEQFGVAVNSVVQVSTSLFSYLILLESGLGSAYLFKMYKPLAEQKIDKVYSLYLGLHRKLKRVAIYMLLSLIVIAIIYPYFLSENDIPYIQNIIILLILGVRFILPYYFTVAKKNLLMAEEKQYLVTFIDGLINSLILLGEIIFAQYLGLRIELTLSIGLIIIIISNLIYKKIINKKYTIYNNMSIKPSYDGDEMTNDILVHQIASIANSNIDIFILSLINLPAVTIYSAYNTAISYPIQLVNKILENIRASIGLKLSSDDKNMYSIFRQLLSLNYFISLVTIPVFIIMINNFITLWIGKEFLLGMFSIIMFALILFHRLTINLIYIIRDGRGLYKESKNFTLTTAILNAVLSIILVNFYSINGLLVATVITNYCIMDFGNLKLVYNTIFNKSFLVVIKDYFSLALIIYISTILSNIVITCLFYINVYFWSDFIIKFILVGFISFTIAFIFMFLFNTSFKEVLNRIRNINR